MNSMTTKVHLVTIVCGNELEERVARDLAALGGSSGFTATRANGRGLHGPRKFGVTDSANIRLEILVVPPWADKVVAGSPADPEFFIYSARKAAGLT